MDYCFAAWISPWCGSNIKNLIHLHPVFGMFKVDKVAMNKFMTNGRYRSWKRLKPVGERPESPIQLQNPRELMRESGGSGFLLDWLAGGEACARDIQGFSVRFENLVAINAREASAAGQPEKKHAHAR